MRTLLLVAVSAAALTGVAIAQEGPHGRGGHDMFQADSNSDDVLTRAEFDAGHDAMFARLDANSDGQLACGEHRRGRHRGERGMNHMSRADANGDGAISREEFLAHPTQMFARLDTNSDGVISTEEQTQMRARHEARGEERHGGRGHEGGEGHHGGRGDHPNPDANGDHQVSSAEFAAMGGVMFERLDANDDGRVTREEAAAAHQGHRGH
jgi:Ca2+-binding EF-hand superfamily protein